jgi:hypothetical protein
MHSIIIGGSTGRVRDHGVEIKAEASRIERAGGMGAEPTQSLEKGEKTETTR